jgi:hypothetical protein
MPRIPGLLATGLGVAVALGSLAASADTPGRHPRYLHARSDLRLAQRLLDVHDEPNVMHHVHKVREHVVQAIHQIDRAAVLDRKDIDDHPRIDANLDRPGRFGKVMALLVSARNDIDREEDNPSAVGWRNLAHREIDAARDQLRKAAQDLRMDRLEGF